jgi:predicted lipoprotein with Yx(FWY)xxD motif
MSSNPSVFRTRMIAALGGLVLLVAACSSAGASTAPSVASVATPAPTSASSPAGSGSAAATVTVATGSVGSFLAGEGGKTLYTFAADSANTTACTGTCATTWPPFVVQGNATVMGGDGVAGTLATFARPDGSMQVTYNGIPLYYYSGDTKAGDTNGQGFAGKWYVASPTGAQGSPAPSASSGGGGY